MVKQGWVEERKGQNGWSYRARYWVPGEEKPRSRSFNSSRHGSKSLARAAANAFLAEVNTDIARGSFVAPSVMTVTDLVGLWITTKQIADNSRYTYRAIIKHLPADLGVMPVQSVTPLHVQASFAALAESVGPSILRLLNVILRGSFNHAVESGIIARSPMRGVPRPAEKRQDREVWTMDQLREFLVSIADHPNRAIWTLAGLTGMRVGEIAALRWSDLDLTGKQMTIQRTVTRDANGRSTIGSETKTRTGIRTIPLSDDLVSLLRAQKVKQLERRLASGKHWRTEFGDLVFDGGEGQLLPLHRLNPELATACTSAGVPVITMHGFRHGFATILLSSGTNAKVVAELLGDRVETVLKTYAHVSHDHRRQAMADLTRSLAGGDADRDRSANTTT